jgi:small-conductance mechanosensitive channel
MQTNYKERAIMNGTNRYSVDRVNCVSRNSVYSVNQRRYTQKALTRAVGVVERFLIIIVALMGISGGFNAAQCALTWTAIIAFAELARLGITNNLYERK